METLKFTPKQTEILTFPVGCPVWYLPNINDDGTKTAEGRNQYPVMPGTIESVTMDLKSMQINYHVEKDGKIIGGGPISEKELAFAFQCPVIISPEGDGEPIDGVVLQSRNGGTGQNGVVYTVMHDVPGGCKAYKDGIQASRVKYRKVAKDGDATPALKSSPLKSPEQKVTVARDVPSNVSAADDENNDNQPLSAITCDSAAKSVGSAKNYACDRGTTTRTAIVTKEAAAQSLSAFASTTFGVHAKHTRIPPTKTPSEVIEAQKTSYAMSSQHAEDSNNKCIFDKEGQIPTPKEARRDSANMNDTSTFGYGLMQLESLGSEVSARQSEKRKESTKSADKMNQDCQSFEIAIPQWLQKCDRLYAHLYGPTKNPYYKQIRKAANCNLFVQKNDFNEPIYIKITHYSPTPALKQFHIARKMVEDIILSFQLPGQSPIIQDGSRGRLLYEIAKEVGGSHKPKQSTSGAVIQRNPFSPDKGQCCMSLVELPSKLMTEGKIFHGSFLIDQHFLDRINRESGCFIKVCGVAHEVPVDYGDPYVLVIGPANNWRGVDRAVELVNAEIRKHQSHCICSMLK